MNVKKTKAVSATPKSVDVNGLSAAVGYDYFRPTCPSGVDLNWNRDPLTQTIDIAEAT